MVFNTTFKNISAISWRSVIEGGNHGLFIAEILLISISVERGRATLPRFFSQEGPPKNV